MSDDKIQTHTNSILAPAEEAFPIVPHASNALSQVAKAIYVGGAGDIVCTLASAPDTEVTFVGVPAGTVLPIRVHAVRASSSATNMIGLV